MRKKNWFFKTILIVMTILFIGVGCASVQSVKDWGPKQKAIYASGLYVKQWDSYISKIAYAAGMDPIEYGNIVINDQVKAQEIANNANLTEEERILLRAKKKALIGMEIALDLYETSIDSGTAPSPVLEQQLLNFINQLEKWALAL